MKTTKNLTMRLGFAVGLLTAMLVAQETGNPDKKPADRNAEPERNDAKIADQQPAPSPAKQRNTPGLPTIPPTAPPAMPISNEMVTQTIPIRYANATQMIKDLNQLLPDYATLTANESANALVLTDTQSDARRMVEIVR